jgi:hypothetical protein
MPYEKMGRVDTGGMTSFDAVWKSPSCNESNSNNNSTRIRNIIYREGGIHTQYRDREKRSIVTYKSACLIVQ